MSAATVKVIFRGLFISPSRLFCEVIFSDASQAKLKSPATGSAFGEGTLSDRAPSREPG